MTVVAKLEPFRPLNNEPFIKLDKPEIRNGRVVSITSEQIFLDIAGERQPAQKAFSCFIEPRLDDRVICSHDETGQIYILGIIERKGNQSVTFSYPAETDMVSETGHLNLRSKESLSLATENLSFFSKKVVHKSREAVVAWDDITATGLTLQASYKTVKLISRMINTMARQVIGSFQGYIRNTEDNDQVRAGQMTRKADGMYSLDSRYTVMVSDKDTKIDGERIHMG